jgi:hypothetical protein
MCEEEICWIYFHIGYGRRCEAFIKLRISPPNRIVFSGEKAQC